MKKLGLFLFFLGALCIGAYFVIGEQFDNITVTFNSNGGSNVVKKLLNQMPQLKKIVTLLNGN